MNTNINYGLYLIILYTHQLTNYSRHTALIQNISKINYVCEVEGFFWNFLYSLLIYFFFQLWFYSGGVFKVFLITLKYLYIKFTILVFKF